jgi:FeS assembly SUF system protein
MTDSSENPVNTDNTSSTPSFVQIQDEVIKVLQTCFDPEIPVNIYELGLIYETVVDPANNVFVKMTLTSPMCPVAGSLPGDVEQKIRHIQGVKDVKVELTFDPPWNQEMMSEAAKLQLGFM